MRRRIDTRGRAMPSASAALVSSYIRSARREHPADNAARLEWLDAAIAELDAQVQSGDWEGNSTSFGGSSQTSKRNIPAADRMAAIEEAIRILKANPDATGKRGPGIIIPRLNR